MSKESEALRELLKTTKDNPDLYKKASGLVDEYLDMQIKRNDLIDKMIDLTTEYIQSQKTVKNSAAEIHALVEMSNLGIKGAENGGATGKVFRNLKYKNDPTLLGSFTTRGTQCGKSYYLTAFIKYLTSEEIYQRPYRHMWE